MTVGELSIYGSEALPYVYIVVAVLGAVLFYGFAEVQRCWNLIQVSTVTKAFIILFLILAWAGLAFARMEWLAFAAMVAFSLIIQVGFVILGGQAGRLLDRTATFQVANAGKMPAVQNMWIISSNYEPITFYSLLFTH